MSIRNLFNIITTFFSSLFSALFDRPKTAEPAPVPAAVQSQVMTKEPKSAKALRRAKLRLMLGRTDGGGKHYGSKRAVSNHRGSGHGKRSGRA